MGKKILYISMNYPDPEAGDAGTKTFSFYFYGLSSDAETEITLLSLIEKDQRNKIPLLPENVTYYPIENNDKRLIRYFGYIRSIRSKIDPSFRYGNIISLEKYKIIKRKCRDLSKKGYLPDLIILEWTFMSLFVDTIKKYFPSAKYIASEQDITYQAYERAYLGNRNRINKIRYASMKKNELRSLRQCDLVVVYSDKDKKLLEKEGIYNTVVLSPYYEKRDYLYTNNRKNILFYGAMYRKENYTAAIWFIQKVMPLLESCDIRFIIVGNHPPKQLCDLASDRIKVTGYVTDIGDYFRDAMCFVAPLIYGAGIKVKILEAMSAGLPVLTNDIGIEGIEGADFFYCIDPEDYADRIKEIVSGKVDCNKMSLNAREFIHRHFNYDDSLSIFKSTIETLGNC